MSKKNKITVSPEHADGENIVREVMTELTAEETAQPKKTRIPFTHRTWAKVAAFILTLLMAAVNVLAAAGAAFLVLENVYTTPKAKFHSDAFQNLAEGVALHSLFRVTEQREDEAEDYLRYKNVSGVEIVAEGEPSFRWEYYKDTGTDGAASSPTPNPAGVPGFPSMY